MKHLFYRKSANKNFKKSTCSTKSQKKHHVYSIKSQYSKHLLSKAHISLYNEPLECFAFVLGVQIYNESLIAIKIKNIKKYRKKGVLHVEAGAVGSIC